MSQYSAFINHYEVDYDVRNIVPVDFLCTPMEELHAPPVTHTPIICSRDSCKAIINPLCAMPPQQLPAELQLNTMEYILKPNNNPPTFLIKLDTCLSQEEFKAVNESLQMALSYIPKECVIAFISFGIKDYTSRLIQDLLGVGRGAVDSQDGPGQLQMNGRVPTGIMPSNKFFQPLSECDMILTDSPKELQPVSWSVTEGKRPIRCLGVALDVAVSLPEATYPNMTARIMTFIGGPCTLRRILNKMRNRF